jgi:peptidoglycan/xylan/chitin deacetylase (PgdA/CDA1 family)
MYHRLAGPHTADPYDVEPALFERQMAALAGEGISGVSLAAARGRDGRIAILTFDDGNATDYEVALPILRKFGFTATFFVSTAHIGSDPHWLDWGQVGALYAAGMQIGTHGHAHRFLDDLEDDALTRELLLPRQLLAENAGITATVMSCPGGRFDARTLRAARAAGYTAVATSIPAMNHFGPVESELVPRFAVQGRTTAQRVLDLVRGKPTLVTRLRVLYIARRSVRSVLGNRVYQAFWERRYTRSRASADR